MTATPKFVFRCSLLLAAACATAACSASGKSAVADPAGTYSLVSVDGKPTPASIDHDGTKLQVRSGTFVIRPDGTCSTTTVFVGPAGGEMTRAVNATYTRDAATLTMRWKGAGTTVGTSDGTTFTMENEGLAWVYRK